VAPLTSGMSTMWTMDGINPVDIAYVGTVPDPDWHIERTATSMRWPWQTLWWDMTDEALHVMTGKIR